MNYELKHGRESLDALIPDDEPQAPNLGKLPGPSEVESIDKNLSAKMHLSDSDRAMLEEFRSSVRRECCYETHSPKEPSK